MPPPQPSPAGGGGSYPLPCEAGEGWGGGGALRCPESAVQQQAKTATNEAHRPHACAYPRDTRPSALNAATQTNTAIRKVTEIAAANG